MFSASSSLQLKTYIFVYNKSSWETNFAFVFWNPSRTQFVNFSFPKKLLTNRVLLTNRGLTNRRMHCISFFDDNFVCLQFYTRSENAPGQFPMLSALQQNPFWPHFPHFPISQFLSQSWTSSRIRVKTIESSSKYFGTTQWCPSRPRTVSTIALKISQ